jgi:hypothetical protein
MNTVMRRELARQPFEQKIRKVAELIRLSRKLKAERVREQPADSPKFAFRRSRPPTQG